MSASPGRVIVAFVFVVCFVMFSMARVLRRRTPSSGMQLGGAICQAIVVATHVAEAMHVFPAMGWGKPDSPGHYLDLTSAALGTVLLVGAGVLAWTRRSRATERILSKKPRD